MPEYNINESNVSINSLPDINTINCCNTIGIETVLEKKTKECILYNLNFKFSNRNIFDIFRRLLNFHMIENLHDTFESIRLSESFEKPYTKTKMMTVEGSLNTNPIPFKKFDIKAARENAKDFLIFTGNDDVDRYSIYALENFRKLLENNVYLNNAIYALPNSIILNFNFIINIEELKKLFNETFEYDMNEEFQKILLILFFKLPKEHQEIFKPHIPIIFRKPKKALDIREQRCKDCSMMIDMGDIMHCNDINKSCKDITTCTFNGMNPDEAE